MDTHVQPLSKSARWTGLIMSGLVILFLLFDGGIKLVPLEIVTQTSGEIGLPTDASFARLLGILTLVGVVLYAIPQTAVLGAILLTGYMGGAIATHLRIDSPLFSHTLVRSLSRRADLGRALSARRARAYAHPVPALGRALSDQPGRRAARGLECGPTRRNG